MHSGGRCGAPPAQSTPTTEAEPEVAKPMTTIRKSAGQLRKAIAELNERRETLLVQLAESTQQHADSQRQLLADDGTMETSRRTLGFSCGARSAFELRGQGYLRNMLSRRQLQGFVM